jgi:hypothetical protein
MTSRKGCNTSSLKEAKQFWLTYRWEFMRRDPEYIRAYNDIMELEGKVQDKSGQDIDSIEAALDEKIKKYYRLFELSMPFFWDPNKPFEEVTKINYETESPGLTQAVFYSTHDQKPVKIYTKYGSQAQVLQSKTYNNVKSSSCEGAILCRTTFSQGRRGGGMLTPVAWQTLPAIPWRAVRRRYQ